MMTWWKIKKPLNKNKKELRLSKNLSRIYFTFHVLCEHIAYQITCAAVNFAITFNRLFHNLAI